MNSFCSSPDTTEGVKRQFMRWKKIFEMHIFDKRLISIQIIVTVQLLTCVWLFATPGTTAHQASLSFTIFWSLLKFMSIESVMLSDHLNLCHPLLLLPSIFTSGSFPVSPLFTSGGQSIGASSSVMVLPINIQSWFPLGLAGLISLLSKGLSRVFSSTTIHNLKASIFWCSAFFMGPTLPWLLERP